MSSIAIFPCIYTDGARILGELTYNLQSRVYTDEMLLADMSKQFGLSVKKTKNIIWENLPTLRRGILKKDKYISLLKCTLDAQTKLTHGQYIYFGLHTLLLGSYNERVFKVLVNDSKRNRVKRAMVKEGLSETAAIQQIMLHDEQASGWTQYLFKKKAYDPSLYDLVIQSENRNFFEITDEIITHYIATNDYENITHINPKCHIPDQGAAYT